MIEVLINIIKYLWSSFFPKKNRPIDPRFLPPVHFNCRCFPIPMQDEEQDYHDEEYPHINFKWDDDLQKYVETDRNF